MTGTALAGLKVCDFTWVGAGSLTTKLLADHGAEVFKIESSVHIDSLRLNPPFAGGLRGVNRSGYFAERNTDKKSVCLNLQTERGRQLARALALRCDVVANNFRPGVMDRFGLGWNDLRAQRPDLIYLAMSMQGSYGPERDYLGYGLTIGALVGLHELSGLPERYPVGTGTNYPDHVPNPGHAAFAVLAALRHRRRTGLGQFIDVAQTEPTVATIGAAIMDFTANGVSETRTGNSHPTWAPHGVYPCSGEDRWIAVAVRSDAEWMACARILHISDPGLGWRAQRDRHARQNELDQLVSTAVSTWDAFQLMDALQAAGVPAGVVQNAADLIDRDPQLAHRRHWVHLEHPEMGSCLYGSPPFRMSATPGHLATAAPTLGADTARVLAEELGLTPQDIAELGDEGVLT